MGEPQNLADEHQKQVDEPQKLLDVAQNFAVGCEDTQKNAQKKYKDIPQRIVAQLVQNPTITRQQLALELGVSPETIKKHLTMLSKNKAIERAGGRKFGR